MKQHHDMIPLVVVGVSLVVAFLIGTISLVTSKHPEVLGVSSQPKGMVQPVSLFEVSLR